MIKHHQNSYINEHLNYIMGVVTLKFDNRFLFRKDLEEDCVWIHPNTGIYVAHAGKWNAKNQFIPKYCIYIGKAGTGDAETSTLESRIRDHMNDNSLISSENETYWRKYLPAGYDVAYSYAEYTRLNIDIVEASLIIANHGSHLFNKDYNRELKEDEIGTAIDTIKIKCVGNYKGQIQDKK